MKSFKPLTTGRLILRRLEMGDSADFYRYRSRLEVCEFQTFRPRSIKEAEAFIKCLAETPDILGTWFQLAVCLKEDNSLIGDIGLNFWAEAQAEIAYTIDPEYQGLGYATEAVSAVLHYLFADLGKHRIIASVDPRNEKSLNLLNMMGMRKEGHFRKSIRMDGIWADDCIYAILYEEWKKRIRI